MKLWSDNDINPVTDLCRSHAWLEVPVTISHISYLTIGQTLNIEHPIYFKVMMTSLSYLDDVHIHYLFNQLILYYLYMKQKKDMLSMLSTQNRY